LQKKGKKGHITITSINACPKGGKGVFLDRKNLHDQGKKKKKGSWSLKRRGGKKKGPMLATNQDVWAANKGRGEKLMPVPNDPRSKGEKKKGKPTVMEVKKGMRWRRGGGGGKKRAGELEFLVNWREGGEKLF